MTKRIRAKYNAIPTDKNPYLKKGWKPNKVTIRVGIVYMLTLIAALATFVALDQPVLVIEELLSGNPPFDIAIEEKPARRQETVHLLEVGLEDPPPHEELLRSHPREALVAAAGGGVGAGLLIDSPHHHSVPMTYTVVLVQGVDDRHLRQRVPGLAKEVVPHVVGVLEVHHVGLDRERARQVDDPE